ncbi:hypothetical protein H8E88_29450 [candidate division KSB1 bacterium]|nr:hypothetical protein [candidate division KSB1 bacterium]MBL7094035.1 hypothetical protein [candidate division KSB1 bacterium]
MQKILILLLFFLPTIAITISYAQEVPFTQEDKERLVRTETKVEEGQKAINQRIEDLRDEMRDMRTFMLWGFGLLFGGMGGLITVVIWDRRTALSPVIRRNKQLEEIIEKVFKQYARVEPKFNSVLKDCDF